MTDRMRSSPKDTSETRGSATGRSKSYRHRQNSQANSRRKSTTFLKAAEYRNTVENLADLLQDAILAVSPPIAFNCCYIAITLRTQGQDLRLKRLSGVRTLRSIAGFQSQLRHVAVLMHGPSEFINLASFERYSIAAYPADVNGFLSGCHGHPQTRII
jgi:hypothetical protein